jgi:hypothetical protein
MRYSILFALALPLLGMTQEFPKDWLGTYEGDMIVANINQASDTIAVTFECVEVIPDSVWSYTMIFHSERYGVIEKNYNIIAKEKGNRRDFLLDENNGIVMELTYMDATFYGMYEVMETYYVTTFQHRKDGLFYDLFAAPVKNGKTSSTTGENPIEAQSFKPVLHQTVLFKPKS